MGLTQEENMTLDLMIAGINDDLKEALVTDGRESDAEVLQERYSLLRKLSQIAAAEQERLSPSTPDRRIAQLKGEHPAPCARFCEANAFQIEIRRLKKQLATPVTWG